jgi:hypothetical protein
VLVAVSIGVTTLEGRPLSTYRYRLTRSGRCDLQNRRRVEPGVSSAVPTAVAVRGSIS